MFPVLGFLIARVLPVRHFFVAGQCVVISGWYFWFGQMGQWSVWPVREYGLFLVWPNAYRSARLPIVAQIIEKLRWQRIARVLRYEPCGGGLVDRLHQELAAFLAAHP